MQFVEPSRQFVKDSIRLVKRCTKPDRKGKAHHKTGHSPHFLFCLNRVSFHMGLDLFVMNASQLPIWDLNLSSCPFGNGFMVLVITNLNVSFSGMYSVRCVRVVLKLTLWNRLSSWNLLFWDRRLTIFMYWVNRPEKNLCALWKDKCSRQVWLIAVNLEKTLEETACYVTLEDTLHFRRLERS